MGSIRLKLILIVSGIGVFLGTTTAVVTSLRSADTSAQVMGDDAVFIVNLLSENLALGMQTRAFDGGEALDQTIKMLKVGQEESIVEGISIYDTQLQIVKTIKMDTSKVTMKPIKHLEITHTNNHLTAIAPIIDIDGATQGYLYLLFTKQKLKNQTNKFIYFIIIFTFIMVVVTGILSYFVGRSVATPIVNLVTIAEKIGNKDLIQRGEITSKDEIGVLARAINRMADNIASLVKKIRDSSTNVSTTAEEFSTISEQIASDVQNTVNAADETCTAMEEMAVISQNIATNADGLAKTVSDSASSVQQMGETAVKLADSAANMASNVSTTSAAIEQIFVTFDRISDNMEIVNQLSTESHKEATTGGKAVQNAITGMKQNNEMILDIASTIQQLGQRSKKIGSIVEVIEEIADQTNLLALNAAIEAARAGESGKGFAVVAEEVRKLAERSMKATRDISNVINQVQNETQAVVASFEDGAESAQKLVSLADEAGQAITRIIERVNSTSDLVQEVSAATQEQALASESIKTGIEEINQLTQYVSQAAQEQATGVKHIVQTYEEMTRMTDEVKVATMEQRSGSEHVLDSARNISETSRDNLMAVQQFSRSAQDMAEQAMELQSLVQEFKVSQSYSMATTQTSELEPQS